MCELSKMLMLTIALLMIQQSWGRQQQFLRQPTDVTAIAGQKVRNSFEISLDFTLEHANEGCAGLHSGGQGGVATVD